MLKLISDSKQKEKLQKRMKLVLETALSPQGNGLIGFPSGIIECPIFSNGSQKLWFASYKDNGAKIPRFWNGFGSYDPDSRNQTISVEINIPLEKNSGEVAGFFAEDTDTGEIFIMHSGKVGGGKKGVGKNAFLAWSRLKLSEVLIEDGGTRDAIIIAKIDQSDLANRIWKYTKKVSAFKVAVRAGLIESPAFKKSVEDYERYSKEFSGRKRGKNSTRFDYRSYHGDVVDALFNEVSQRRGVVAFNSRLIDLYVKKKKKITEVYEVKTSVGRQALYTAIGQIMTHTPANNPDIRRVLVLPFEENVPEDINAAILALDIEVRRFKISLSKKKWSVELM